jgi:hypothetical protein
MEDMDKPSDGRFWSVGGKWAKMYINDNLLRVHKYRNKLYRYRDRYWRESAFRGMELVRKTLEEVYGADKVSMVSATFRWLNHHSVMKSEYNGKKVALI